MDPIKQLEFIQAILSLGDGFADTGNLWGDIWWRTDNEYAPVTFFVGCNDLFYWATADSETLTPENFPLLQQALIDVRTSLRVEKEPHSSEENWKESWTKWYHAGLYATSLFCARLRKMRPQHPCYKDIPDPLKPLFDACGPERDPKTEG